MTLYKYTSGETLTIESCLYKKNSCIWIGGVINVTNEFIQLVTKYGITANTPCKTPIYYVLEVFEIPASVCSSTFV